VRVSVVGQGYVGTALALAAHKAGHKVLGIEIDAARLKALATIGYEVSSSFSEIASSEVVVIAVPTPLDLERKPDLSYLEAACSSIAPHLSAGTLVVNESTSYPGTLRNLIAPRLGSSALYAAAPERVDPGNESWDLKRTPRVIGALSDGALERAVGFYKTVCDEVVTVSSPEVAEAAKLFENTFRQVNIALVNEFAQIASALGISTWEVLAAADSKPFGFMKFLPSVGVGGHCIPVDPSYLSYVAEKSGKSARFIDLANLVNLEMPKYVAARIDEELGGVSGKKIQVVGIAYKANVADLRESPAIALIGELRALGAVVSWCDPLVGEWNGENSAAIEVVDAGVVVSPHEEIDLSVWKSSGMRVFDVSTAANLGWPKFL